MDLQLKKGPTSTTSIGLRWNSSITVLFRLMVIKCSIVWLTRLGTWAVSVSSRLLKGKARWGHRQRLYAYMYSKMLANGLNQVIEELGRLFCTGSRTRASLNRWGTITNSKGTFVGSMISRRPGWVDLEVYHNVTMYRAGPLRCTSRWGVYHYVRGRNIWGLGLYW